MNREKTLKLVEAVIKYSQGIDNTTVMDWLTMECTDYEWASVLKAFEVVDEVEVDNGIGTISQTEEVLSRREKRPNRYPSTLLLFGTNQEEMKADAQAYIDKLASEFKKRGIKFNER